MIGGEIVGGIGGMIGRITGGVVYVIITCGVNCGGVGGANGCGKKRYRRGKNCLNHSSGTHIQYIRVFTSMLLGGGHAPRKKHCLDLTESSRCEAAKV